MSLLTPTKPPAATSFATLVDVLRARARERPHDTAYIYLADGETEAERWTWTELERRVEAVAGRLHATGPVGERALLLYPSGLDFVAAFLGCLAAGWVAVPAYPPRRHKVSPRLRTMVSDCRPAAVLSTAAILSRREALLPRLPGLERAAWWATDGNALEFTSEDGSAEVRTLELTPDHLAFLQYTSGSTADPKGVMVSHGQLLDNEETIRRAFEQSEASVVVSWLPVYHDMGLIGGVLQPLFVGGRCVLMSPMSFLQRPMRWLRAIDRYGATTSGGPDFGYNLCVRHSDDAERAGLDLSGWQVAFNGAEPVRAQTLERFASAFAPSGFDRRAFFPCYGLAEATLFVTGGPRTALPTVVDLDPQGLEANQVRPPEDEATERQLVGCGRGWRDQRVEIVDPTTHRRCAPDQVGEIWLQGSSVATGYWQRAEITEETFAARLTGERLSEEPDAGRFLRTGDLGFLRDGELFITGRLKDLIILRGRNVYPQDIEWTAESSHALLRPGCVAAFAVDLEDTEGLVVVLEVVRRRPRGDAWPPVAEAVVEAVRRAVAEEHDVAVHEVVLIETGTVPKTTSGKIRRGPCRDLYLADKLRRVDGGVLSASTVAGATPEALAIDLQALLASGLEVQQAAILPWLGQQAAQLVGVPAKRVQPETSLLALGIDSLGAVELKQRVMEELSVDLPIAQVLGGASLAALGQEISARLGTAEAVRPTATEAVGEHPASYGQRALWFLRRLAPESSVYHIAGAARVISELDVERLKWACGRLAARHPALRTTLRPEGDDLRQQIHRRLAPDFAVRDLAGASLEVAIRRAVEHPFDLEHGPLWRLRVLRSVDETVLVWVIHHAVADLASLGVLMRELSAILAGEEARLEPLAAHYGDFARAQRAGVRDLASSASWSYWQEQLASLPVLELTGDRPRPTVQTYRGTVCRRTLSRELNASLARRAESWAVTRFTVLLGAYVALLHRLTDQQDLVVGAPMAGRLDPSLASLVGYFVNPAVLRADLEGDLSFTELMQQLRGVVAAAIEHQDFPFPRLVELLQPERDPGRSPLFQAMLAHQTLHEAADPGLLAFAVGQSGERLNLGEMALESLTLEGRTAPFDLSLTTGELGGRLAASLEINADLFDRTTGRRFLRSFETLLASALQDPDRKLGDLGLLSGVERFQMLTEWGATEFDLGDRRSAGRPGLAARVAGRAQGAPERIAIVAGDVHLSYRALDERAGRLAAVLRGLGVEAEEAVGVCMGRDHEMVVALLAILRAGGVYLSLDPAYPSQRLALMIEDSGCRRVLTRQGAATVLAGTGVHLIDVDRLDVDRAKGSAASGLLVEASEPGRLAYVLYTSGSTGRPKGVAITDGSAGALVDWARGQFTDRELSSTLAATSINFDLSVFEIFLPLCLGGTVIVAENALELISLPASSRVTLINTVPSAIAELVRLDAVPASVRTVNLAGEPLTRSLSDRVLDAASVRRVYNLYGPSEDTTYSTWHRVVPGSLEEPTIGRAISGTCFRVLDRRLRPVAIGVPGELGLGGYGLARGYLGRPGRSARSFVPDPCGQRPGARLYRTGDRVRLLGDGELEFLGRLDRQIKLRGYRVELGEIEVRLGAHPAVAEAAVVVPKDGHGDRLVAYWMPKDGVVVEDVDLARDLGEELPPQMVPSIFAALDALPLLPNGKVNRRQLASRPLAEDASVGARGTATVAPRTPTEKLLAGLWSELLGVERVGVDDGFFALGGHSLLATRALSRIRELWDVELPVAEIFSHPTVATLAARIDAAQADAIHFDGGRDVLPPVEPLARDAEPVLSFAQERWWFLERLEPGAAYNVPFAVRLDGPLDDTALGHSLQELVRRHEALRTHFPDQGGRPVAKVRRATDALTRSVVWARIDLNALTPAERRVAEGDLKAEAARRPFDLARGPLWRFWVVRQAEDQHLILVALHHMVCDGASLAMLWQELASHYRGFQTSTSGAFIHTRSARPPLLVQYSDFAAWQRRTLSGERLTALLDHWRARLAGLEDLELPADRLRSPELGEASAGASCPIVWGGARAARLRRLAQSGQATPFMVLAAGFASLLGRLSGRRDLALGVPVSHRSRPELEGVIGPFINTVVLRLEMPQAEAARFDELLSHTKVRVTDAFAHQDLPFEKLVEELRPQRRLDTTPLFQTMLAVQRAPQADQGASGLEGVVGEPQEISRGTSNFDLTLSLTEGEDSLTGYLEYRRDLFDATTVRRWARHLGHFLDAASRIEAPLAELPLLGRAERHQIVREWNPAAEVTPSAPIHHLFFEQAARRGAGAAVVDPASGEIVSYQDLADRARHIGDRLQDLGLAPGSVVGILMERSADLVAAFLGALDAGLAYLPLDREAPATRLAGLLEDAGVRTVLVDDASTPRLPAGAWTALRLGSEAWVPSAGVRTAREHLKPRTAGEDAAYVIYTSGSTGRPKGVVVSHRALASYVLEAARAYGLGTTDRVLQLNALSFDASVEEIYPTLASGGTLVLRGPDLESTTAFFAFCARQGITVLDLPTAFWHGLVADLELEAIGEHSLPSSLRLVILGGEAASVERLATWRRHGGDGVRLVNTYGPTEATIVSARWPASRVGQTSAELPLGRPVDGDGIRVLDARLRALPVGAVGELCIVGSGLARGYLGRPQQTAEAFVPDPFGRPDARLYRTGDLARYQADGTLVFQGRRDRQVKIRGFRIEPGEIENALTRHPTVREAAVVAPADRVGQRLVAFVTFAEEGADEEASQGATTATDLRTQVLRDGLAQRLPQYMVPSPIEVLAELPRTITGKIDRAALEARAMAPRRSSKGTSQWLAPRNPREELVAAIFAELLEIDEVSATDDFFALGGHSLLATQAISRLRRAFGVELPLRTFFEAATVARLARAVAAARAVDGGPRGSEAIPRSQASGPAPLSFAQERLWFLDRLEPGGSAYNVASGMRLRGQLDALRLAVGLAAVVARHETLRATFAETEAGPVQVIRPADAQSLTLPSVDVSGLDAAARRDRVVDLGAAFARQPFDLATGPLLRAQLVRLGEDEHVLLLAMHHIVCDGWSVGVLVRELAAFYAGGEAATLPPLPIQYSDYARWQRDWLGGNALNASLDYWRRHLHGVPVLELPVDRPRIADEADRGQRRAVRVPQAVSDGLRALARRRGVTPFMALLAVFRGLLVRLSGQHDVAIGTPVAHRRHREVEGLIGFFVNTLVLRLEPAADESAQPFHRLLERVRETTLDADAYQDLPFERLVEALAPRRRLQTTPLFQAMFILQTAPGHPPSLPGLELEPLHLETGAAKFDLTLDLEDESEGFRGFFEARSLFDATTIDRWSGYFVRLLEGVVERPDARLQELPWMSATERHQLQVEWGEDSQANVLDRQGEVAPIGVVGDLWTREPSAEADGQRVRRRADGSLEEVQSPTAESTEGSRVGKTTDRPATPLETQVAEVWREVLGSVPKLAQEGLSLDDDFFALGGHSLLATRMVAKLRQTFGVELPLRQVFDTPTIAGIAHHLEVLRSVYGEALFDEPPPLVALSGGARQRVDRSGQIALPCSFAQERMLFLEGLRPGTDLYHMPAAFDVQGDLDVGRLAVGLQQTAARHEVLRTAFGERDGRPFQQISADPSIDLGMVDLSALDPADRDVEARRQAKRGASQPFNLVEGPLWRSIVLRSSPNEHRLLITLHHLIADGASVPILVREIAAGYREDLSLAPLDLQYGDYAAWQREWMSGEVLAREVDHWVRQVGEAVGLELPVDRPQNRLADRVPAAGLCPLPLSAPLAGELRELGRRRGATLFMTLLAALQGSLARWCDRDQVAVGSPIAGRDRAETEPLIGLFVNTLALAADASGDPTFETLLTQVQARALEAFDHQHLPFEKLVEALGSDRQGSLVPVIFALEEQGIQEVLTEAQELSGLELQPRDPEIAAAKFELTIVFVEQPDGSLQGTLEYDADLFDATTVQRFARGYRQFLEAAVADPSSRLSSLAARSPVESQMLLREWNDNASVYPAERGLAELFAEQAIEFADATALIVGDVHCTYGELATRSRGLASRLTRHGVQPGDRVGICAERSIDLVVGTLAILRAGAVYVPLDPTYPASRLAFMLEDTGTRVVLTHHGLFASGEQTVLDLEAEGEPDANVTPNGTPQSRAGDDLAYVMYTSGSTGRPKGVAIPQRAVMRLVRGSDYVALELSDRVAFLSNTSFDAATFEIWGALLNGACLQVFDRETVLAPGRLGEEIRRRRISAIFLTTALFQQIARLNPTAYSGVSHVLFGGESVDPRPVRQVMESAPPRRLLHVYGPTESTTFATWHRVESVPPEAVTVPIGRPIANTRGYVLDRDRRPVALGAVGELYLGGDGLAREYLGRPRLNAERFVTSPALPGERLYHTGDLVRLLAGGQVEFIGRRDHQVKLRGFRIELGEVEAALAELSEVAEVLVLVREDLPGGRGLVAFLTGAQGVGNLEVSTLRARLGGRLPSHMVPARFVELAAMPLNPNGKVDRAVLQAMELPRLAVAEEAATLAGSPTEEILAGIFAELLGGTSVTLDDDFFELGGHSLLATQLTARVLDVFEVRLAVASVFNSPTVRGLAAEVEAALGNDVGEASGPIPAARPEDRSEAAPLSFAQQRLWFLDQLQPGSVAYNVPAAVRLRGRLEPEALRRALEAVVERHETLRTRFTTLDGEGMQQVSPPAPVQLPRVDLRTLTDDRRQAEARALALQEAGRHLGLTQGPLWRAVLLALGEDEHALLLTMHHIISDGWSVGVLLRELATFYRAFAERRPPSLPSLAIQYGDYARWQRRRLVGDALEQRLDYWRQQLADLPPVLDLPADRPRASGAAGAAGQLERRLPVALSTALETRSREAGATLFMTGLAAFQVLLWRLTGSRDLTVGTPVAGRERVELEGLIGFLVNTLVLRGRPRSTDTFGQLLDRLRRTTLGAFAHQDLPFEKLVQELSPDRDLLHTPLFQVMFIVQNAPMPTPSLGDVALEPMETAVAAAKFDLTLELQRRQHGWTAALEYDADRFDGTTARRWLGAYVEVLRAVSQASDPRLADLVPWSAAERHQLLGEWNDTGRAALDVDLIELFRRQTERTPDAVALVSDGRQLSYAALERRAVRLAADLRRLGVTADAPVGVLLERSEALIVSLLAVLESGGAYVPLDPAYPTERLRFTLADAGAKVLISRPELLDQLGEGALGLQLLTPDGRDSQDAVAVQPKDSVVGDFAQRLAYVIYTSGSTGRPKGVAISHAAAASLVRWPLRAFEARELDAVLATTSVCFDLSIFEIFVPLSRGGRVVLARDALALADPASGLADERPTLLNTVPSALTELLRLGGLPPSIRTVNLAGEPLERRLVDETYRQATVQHVWNLYGPSEDTTYSTAARVPRTDDAPTIGRPLEGTDAYVLDQQGNLRAVGIAGELCLAGAGLARGYLGRARETAERFVPDRFSVRAGGRRYRTGDLTRLRRDGELDFLGRLDHQVKVRGFRIELGEIEHVLLDAPGVREVVVVCRDSAGGARLAAYVAAEGSVGDAGEEALRAQFTERVVQRLPAYMTPSDWVFLDALPRLPNGKVDRAALPAPRRAAESTASSGALDPLGQIVAGLWSELLGVADVAPDDDFFALGGHSLLATRLVARVRSGLGVDLPLRILFEAPTLRAFVERLRTPAAELSEAAVQIPQLVPRTDSGSPPLSFAQERMWFLDRLQPGSSYYNLPAAFELCGDVSVPALAAAATAVVCRHEGLRTTFVDDATGEPRQVTSPAHSEVPLARVDLSGLPPTVRELELAARCRWEAARSFDLARGPLLRFTLIRLADDRHVVLVTLHHIVGDAWSLGVLARELMAAYRAAAAGREIDSGLPTLPVQYADYAVWQRGWLRDGVLAREIEHWRERLAGAPPVIDLPSDRPRPTVRGLAGDRRTLCWSGLAGSAADLGRRTHATPFMVLLAAFGTLLERYVHRDDLVVGSPVAGRSQLETEGLIGFFVNTLVLRLDLTGRPSFEELLGRVRAVTLDAYEHQELPFEKLVDELAPQRDLAHTPLFQVALALQNTPLPSLTLDGLTLEPLPLATDTAKFDLTLAFEERGDDLLGSVEYSTELFDSTSVDRLIRHLHELLTSAIARPERPVADLGLLSRAEQHQVVVEARHRPVPAAAEQRLHRLFLAQAAAHPNRPAVTFEGQSLTYSELADDARRLAWRLRRLGVGPESRVGLCLDRSPRWVTGILGVLAAGGAYVPLDPVNPPDRLRYVIEDARIEALITEDGVADWAVDLDLPCLSLDIEAENAAETVGHDDHGSWPADDGFRGDSLAYVIYTSGSTGRPKGVSVTHANVARLMSITEDRFGFGPRDVWTLFHSCAFDFSVWELWGALAYGGRLVVVPYVVSRSPKDFAELLVSEGVTVLNQTASAFRQLTEVLPPEDSRLALRWVIFGGEALDLGQLRQWIEKRGDRSPRLINMYGITETTVHVTFRAVERRDLGQSWASPIGVGIDDLELFVLDRRRQPLPRGVPGELYVGGAGLARGYLYRPALTAQRFVPDPFGGGSGARLYRTGDLVRGRGDGDLEYLGRIDAQVKVRGFRIELGEIEAVLTAHPQVKQAAVCALDDGGSGDVGSDRRLVAFLCPEDGAEPAAGELRSFCGRDLPDYMVPSAFTSIERLPLNINGKLDRGALARLAASSGHSRPDLGVAYVAPRTAEEKAVAEIWRDALAVERVGVEDNFFDLGGNSLLMARVQSRLEAAFDRSVPMLDLFQFPTVASLAEQLERTKPGAAMATDVESATGDAADDGDGTADLENRRVRAVDRRDRARRQRQRRTRRRGGRSRRGG